MRSSVRSRLAPPIFQSDLSPTIRAIVPFKSNMEVLEGGIIDQERGYFPSSTSGLFRQLHLAHDFDIARVGA